MKVTIFIPVYNGEHDHLEETLEAVYRQKAPFEWNVLVTDSGSTDRSVEILKRYEKEHENFRIVQIKKEEYSHGRTRQWAAEVSDSDYMVYLSQDAVPYNDSWLKEMIAPFEISPDIAGVVAKQKPRPYCFPGMKYDIQAVFNEQGVDDAITLWYGRDESFRGNYTKESFYSDVCSAAPRDFLVSKIGYRDVKYSEDYEFGKDIIDAGYIKVYSPKAVVEHSNDVKLSDYKNRIFDETFNVRINSGQTNQISIGYAIKSIVKDSIKDLMKIFIDRDYTWKRKIYWLLINPLFHIEKWRGIRLANRVDLDADIKSYSLEYKGKKNV